MKRIVFALTLLLVPHALAGRILVDAVDKMVVFIYAAKPDGAVDPSKPMGSGFLVLVPKTGSENPLGKEAKTEGAMPLVTARHMFDPQWSFCPGPPPATVYLRVNTKNYNPKNDASGIAYVQINLITNNTRRYLVSDDEEVDAAVIDVGRELNQDMYDAQPIRLSVFGSPEELKKLQVSDGVFSAGLIPGQSGEKRNYPFFKFGAISSIPDESVWIGCGANPQRLERVWFIAANLVAGNSGSPIFFLPENFSPERAILIGVQSSSFGGADIAGMTPIEDVFKIIEKNAVLGAFDLFRGDETNRKN